MIDFNKYITRQNLIRIAVGVMAILVIFICYDNLVFRLKSSSPSMDKVPDSSTKIRFHFSQPIASVDKVTLNDVEVDAAINGKVVTVPLSESLESDVTYKVILSDIKSQWFGSRIASIDKSFIPKYIAFNELSGDEKAANINASNSGQVDDVFISKNVFPIFNERWQIDAKVITDRREAVLSVKFFEEIPNYDNNGVVERVSNENAEKYRSEVLAEIKKREGNPDDYEIFYENPYLADKYRVSEEH